MRYILALLVSTCLIAQGRLPRIVLIPDPATGAPGELLLREDRANGSDYIRIRPAASVPAPYTLTLPSALPGANSVMTSTAIGDLGWSALSGFLDTTSAQTVLPGAIKTFQERVDWYSSSGALRVRINQAGSSGLLTIHSGSAGSESNPVRLGSSGIGLNGGASLSVYDAVLNETVRLDDTGAFASMQFRVFTTGTLRDRVAINAGLGAGSLSTSAEVAGVTTVVNYVGGGSIIAKDMLFSDRVFSPTFSRVFKVPTSGDSFHSYIWPTTMGSTDDCFKRGAGSPGFDVQTYWGPCGGAVGNFITLDTDQITAPDWVTGDKVMNNATFTFRTTSFFTNNTVLSGGGLVVQDGSGTSLVTLGALGTSPLEIWKNSSGITRWERDQDKLLGYTSGGGLNYYSSATRLTLGSSISTFTGIPSNRGVSLVAGNPLFVVYNNSGQTVWEFGYGLANGTIETRGTDGILRPGVTGVCGTVTVYNGIVTDCAP